MWTRHIAIVGLLLTTGILPLTGAQKKQDAADREPADQANKNARVVVVEFFTSQG